MDSSVSSRELYCKGARVWVPDPAEVWKAAEVRADFKTNVLSLETEEGESLQLTVKKESELPPLRNPDILIGENDLTSLSYLHEPAVLYNLKFRFINQDAIYTYCGIVLVAINPYKDLPIYGNDTIFAYRGQAMGDLDPHIFAVAEAAYTKMEKDEENQSIIVSGESGAGKTVSAKYAMRYFATVGGSSTETQIEKKVLASSPIMEAIGNAKTTRNDNSSRFGKYIEIDFSRQFNIVGASMRTYLLEKSRVVFQAPQERNYHIFYQLCASRKQSDLQDMMLDHQDNFHYTNQGFSPTIPGVDDVDGFEDTRSALTLLGFGPADQKNLFKILAAILHLGNVTIDEALAESDQESSAISPTDDHLLMMARLLEISAEEMRMWLCHRKIVSMREVFNKPMTVSEAIFARDALAKHIYAKLFDWIVSMVNKSLATSEKGHKFIGVLDIYGFETFEINSFEQFCINYANEKLQQQFNQHVFKLEQEEYVREQIEWQFIDFYDNQPCIDLIESKLGILDLLDEECKMPRGSDQSWVEKLYDKCKKSEHFSKPRLSNSAFIIHHFADNVAYESVGFLEKNRDTVVEEQINILKASQNDLVMDLFMEEDVKLKLPKPAPRSKTSAAKVAPYGKQAVVSSKQHKKSVGSQFRDSLNLLMMTLNSTTPHYVRCIKPNDEKEPFVFDPKRAVQQLRACGVLETIRISAAGYPSRWTYQDFFLRYRVLCRSGDIKRDNMRATSERILRNVIKKEDQYQFGKTKIFIRAGQVAYLEKLRSDKLRACGVMIQKHVRGWLVRTRYMRLRKATILFQCHARGFLARRKAQHLRQTRAAITIQRYVRGFVKWQQYQRTKTCIIRLQAHIRGMWARKRYTKMVHHSKAIIIQKCVRGFLARRRYQRELRSIVIVQSCARRWFARRELKRLKVEARSVEHMKKLNKGLENKIISLQQKIEELNKENHSLKVTQNEYNQLRSKVEDWKQKESALKVSSNKVKELDAQVQAMQKRVTCEVDEKMDILNEKELLRKEKGEMEESLGKEILRFKEALEKANEMIVAQEKEAEEVFKKRLEQEKHLLIAEYDQERIAYQRLLKDYHRLEQKHENMEGEVLRLRSQGDDSKTHHRTASNVSTISAASEATSEFAKEGDSDNRGITSDAEDAGYGSVRSTLSAASSDTRAKLEAIDWNQSPSNAGSSPENRDSAQQVDIGLVLKLQQKVKEVENDRTRLQKRLEEFEKDESPLDDSRRARELIRLQELEMENAKLKDDLFRLRKVVAESDVPGREKELMEQFTAMQEEMERKREECIQLRAVLANQTQDLKEVAKSYTSRDVDIINEDGELIMAFETQKKIIRQLESELQVEKAKFKECKEFESEYKLEIDRLKEDNERQQKLLSQNLTKNPQSQTEAFMQHEITRLTGENLDLREKLENMTEQLKKYKRQLKIYAKKLKETGGYEATPDLADVSKDRDLMAVVRKKTEREYMGMFEYKKEDEVHLIRSLIYDLKPKVAITLLPGLPSYILFMSIRHTDYVNDDDKVRSLLTNTINAVKRVIKKRHEDLEMTIMWLANTLRLLHNLKQYSGDKAFQTENTSKQNEQCLRNFDLSEYRQVLSDIAVWIYQGVIKLMEEKAQPLIVPAVLEHEAISGLSGQRPGVRGRTSSVTQEVCLPVDARRALDCLLQELTVFFKMLGVHGVDPELITQVFRQIFYFICSGALNNLLLRKDLCHWTKGMQIRYNLSHLEQWCRDQKLHDGSVLETLQPIIQAAQLLQARKTDEDVHSICEMCDKLSVFQIIKILNLYTPADEFEERVPVSFIKKIQAQLQLRADRADAQGQGTLLMDTKFAFPVRFPFNPSNIRLEDIEIPEVLNLPMLKKL